MTALVTDAPPPLALELAAGCPMQSVWRNDLGATTWRLAGHVDLGRLGVADRWADLAPACLSVGWNFPAPDDLSHLLLEGYGVGRDIAPDPERLSWYQRLWNAPGAD